MNNHERMRTRARLIIDNDFGNDPDGLFQLAHHLLSPFVEVRAVIGSRPNSDGYGDSSSSTHACLLAHQLIQVMGFGGEIPVYEGVNARLNDANLPVDSGAARFIVEEAMRTDVQTPLYVACGAGLTNVASAYLLEPKIGKHITLIWIGPHQYNLSNDLHARKLVFNHSDTPMWPLHEMFTAKN